MPITSKLLPFRASNLVYLAEVAAITRLATGVMRVYENRPSQQKNPNVTPSEKRQALAERFFVEIIGTAGYMAFLHMGQDLVGALYDRVYKKTALPKLSDEAGAKLKAHLDTLKLDVGKFNKLIEELYHPDKLQDGKPTSGLIYRVLYEDEVKDAQGKFVARPRANMNGLKKLIIKKFKEDFPNELPPELDKTVAKELKNILGGCEELRNFATKNNAWASAGIITGVALSAFVGGTITQWANDRVVAPWLSRKFNDKAIKPIQPQLPAPGIARAVAQMPSQAMAQNPVNAFNIFANNTVLPPNPPPITPVYLPNPKMQPPATAFSANTLPRPYTSPIPYSRPSFGGRV